jgi:peptidoglycan/LPS O-acetylase OafA/YrhL
MRWVAALLVCITHIRTPIIDDYSHTQSAGVLMKLFYAIHGFGHSAVMVFFVLSGFLVGGEVLRLCLAGEFSWRDYIIRRVARIYPAFLLALLLTAVLDGLGITYLNATGIYSGELAGPNLSTVFKDRLTTAVFTSNLFMLQEILAPPFGSNGPLWSLSYEWWYYLMFPLAMGLVLTPRTRVAKGIFLALILLSILYFVGLTIAAYALIWLLGLIPAIALKWMPRHVWWPALGIAVTATGARFGVFNDYLPSFVVDSALGVFVMLFIGALGRSEFAVPVSPRINESLASFSYSLYVTHWPVALFTYAFLSSVFGLQLRRVPDAIGMMVYGAVLIETYFVAWCVAAISEMHTQRIRSFLRNLFGEAGETAKPIYTNEVSRSSD